MHAPLNLAPTNKAGSFEQVDVDRSPFGIWPHPAVIARNNFVHKSLSNWAFNIAVGCAHGCSFCYVPSTATIKQGPKLAEFGVEDPDLEWGQYVLLREWNEARFLASLRSANETPRKMLPPDGNRAVMYCSTTDPYQVFRHPDPARQRELGEAARLMVRRSLELIRDHSQLNVRILTRSPLARLDFDLFKSFKSRLLFGMSVPTLDARLARLYEPNAPSPLKRMETLQKAKDAGLHVYVAMAPTFPESDTADLSATIKAIAALKPVTVFHEPINIRADNVARITARAIKIGVKPRTDVFASTSTWQDYAIDSFRSVKQFAKEHGLSKQLHLWPDATLGSAACLQKCWSRISEWPQGPDR
jgi:DNA repair photolyase